MRAGAVRPLVVPGREHEGVAARVELRAAAKVERIAAGLVAAAALVVLTQANPWWTSGHEFDPFLAAMRGAAATFRGPVLLVHGDTHFYRADRPFRDGRGEVVENLQRLETWGSPFVGWVEVRVDPSRPEPFTFGPRLHATGVPWWWLRSYVPLARP